MVIRRWWARFTICSLFACFHKRTFTIEVKKWWDVLFYGCISLIDRRKILAYRFLTAPMYVCSLKLVSRNKLKALQIITKHPKGTKSRFTKISLFARCLIWADAGSFDMNSLIIKSLNEKVKNRMYDMQIVQLLAHYTTHYCVCPMMSGH